MIDSPDLVQAVDTLDAVLAPRAPARPVPGPYVLTLEWTWPWLKGDGKRLRARGRVPHDRKPDISNVLKTIEDRLVAHRYMESDQAIVAHRLAKWRGDRPGILVGIETWAPVDALDPRMLATEWTFAAAQGALRVHLPTLVRVCDLAARLQQTVEGA